MPLEEQLAQSRDRITDLLTRKKPELGDIASAFLRSSGGQSTYGEELNRMKAGRLAEQKTLFDVLSGHKKMKQADRQLDLTENQFDFNKMKFKAGQEAAGKKHFEERFAFWAKDLKKQDQVKLYEFARDQYPEADVNADAALSAGMRELGLKKPKPEGDDFTLSPGGRRYDAQGKLIAEAPATPDKPTKPVRITLNPGQIVVDESGNEIARGREKGVKTFALSPGQVVMDGKGNVLARGPEKAQPGFSLAPGGQRFDAQGNPIASVPGRESPGFTLAPGSQRFDAQGNSVAAVPSIPPKPLTAQTPEGKIIQDRELFRKTFGENSEQVAAFDELIDAGDQPEPPKLTDERGIRQEFTKLSAPFVGVQDSFRKVKASAALGTAVGDISLIFAYMKMLDQESVVREGEQATAESARGVPAGIRNFYNKLLTGEKLPPEQKAQFVEAAKALFQIEVESQRNLVQKFTHIATLSSIDPSRVIIDFFLEGEPAKPADPIDALLDQLEAQTR